jgi:hypothetical protein
MKMGPMGALETSVPNHFTPRNNPEDGEIQRWYLKREESLALLELNILEHSAQ